MTKSLRICVTSVALLAASCATPQGSTDPHHPQSSGDRTPTGSEAYHGRIQYRAMDAKPAIVEPLLLPAGEAMLASGTKVIGVYVNGEARAYPLFILNNHQIVNDVVGGTPLSASW